MCWSRRIRSGSKSRGTGFGRCNRFPRKQASIGKKFDGIAEQLTKLRAKAAERSDVTQKLEAFAQTFVKFGPPHPRPGAPPSLFILESTTRLFNEIERADAAPTAAVKVVVADLETKVGPMMDAWHKLLESDLPRSE